MGLCTASRAFATCMAEVSSALVQPKVLVWGGDYYAAVAVDMFDPVSNTWHTFPSALEYREAAASAVINGRLYVCGGHSERSKTHLQRHWIVSIHISAVGRLCRRCRRDAAVHAAAVVDARLYVFGGMVLRSGPGVCRMLRCFDKYVAVTSSNGLLAILCRSGGDQEARVHRRWQLR